MKKLTTILAILLAFALLGCTGKSYYEPTQTFSASPATISYNGVISDLSRNGATLNNGRYIGRKGLSSIVLEKGYRFLDESRSYLLCANPSGILKIIDKKSQKTLRVVALETPVVSASIRGGVVGYILNNNTFGIYKIKSNEKIVESRSEISHAIDTRAASPIFIDNLVVMPMLDGKLIIVSMSDTDNAKVIYISSRSVFNNVIYLSRMGNTMVSATPKKIITLGSFGQSEYSANISEVVISSGKIYIFTKEGEIISLTSQLKEIDRSKFKFAHFAAGTAFGNRVFALDQKGSLIVSNSKLTKHRVYSLGDVEAPVYITGKRLFKDGKIIELSKLGYE